MTSYFNAFVGYLRIPFLASSGLAAVLSAALYFKQKYVPQYTPFFFGCGEFLPHDSQNTNSELIYPRGLPPNARTEVPKPSQFGLNDFEELMIPTPDGEHLSAFLIRPSNKQFVSNITILMFHGNAGNIGHRVPIARVLQESIGANILMLEYRGYGLSTGDPNEKGLTIDGQTGLDYIRQRAELRNTKIIIYGQSLGGAVGIGLAARNQKHGDIAALILENTFLSIRKMIPAALPPARYLAPFCHQIWPSEEMIPGVTKMPILFLSGLQDEIVPPSHMKRLYDICRAPVKIWAEFPHGDHNSTVAESGYFEYIEEFVANQVLRK
jgi:abhydrolase domain-containing protein 13